jgi:hypothetical protein
MVNDCPVVFKSKTQANVSLSTAEAEYVALSLCIQEVLWLKQLLDEMGVSHRKPIVVFEDNQGTIAIANNEGYHSRAKHIDIRHHFIREHIKSNEIKLEYIESKDQLADFLTKAIATKQFQRLLERSNIRSCRSRGSVVVVGGNPIGQNVGGNATQVLGMNPQFKSASGTVSNRVLEGALQPKL